MEFKLPFMQDYIKRRAQRKQQRAQGLPMLGQYQQSPQQTQAQAAYPTQLPPQAASPAPFMNNGGEDQLTSQPPAMNPMMNNGGADLPPQDGNPYSPTAGQGFNLNNMLRNKRNRWS
jgi:hypothetical protein